MVDSWILTLLILLEQSILHSSVIVRLGKNNLAELSLLNPAKRSAMLRATNAMDEPEKWNTVRIFLETTEDLKSARLIKTDKIPSDGMVVKSLLWLVGKQPIMTVLPLNRMIDRGKLTRYLNSKNLRMASRDKAETITGQTIGNISPVGHHSPIRTILDECLLDIDKDFISSSTNSMLVYGGGGSDGWELEIPLQELLHISWIELVDISIDITQSPAPQNEGNIGKYSDGDEAKMKLTDRATSHVNKLGITTTPANQVTPVRSITTKMLRDSAILADSNKLKTLLKALAESSHSASSIEFKTTVDTNPKAANRDESANSEYLLNLINAGTIESGKTALHMAAWKGPIESVRLLLDYGADIDRYSIGPGNFGKTALFYAATQCRDDVIQLLLEKGACVKIVNNKGQTPRSLGPSHLSEETMVAIEHAECMQDKQPWLNFYKSNYNTSNTCFGDLDPRFHELGQSLRETVMAEDPKLTKDIKFLTGDQFNESDTTGTVADSIADYSFVAPTSYWLYPRSINPTTFEFRRNHFKGYSQSSASPYEGLFVALLEQLIPNDMSSMTPDTAVVMENLTLNDAQVPLNEVIEDHQSKHQLSSHVDTSSSIEKALSASLRGIVDTSVANGVVPSSLISNYIHPGVNKTADDTNNHAIDSSTTGTEIELTKNSGKNSTKPKDDNLVVLVGYVSSKRRLSRSLVFANIIPLTDSALEQQRSTTGLSYSRPSGARQHHRWVMNEMSSQPNSLNPTNLNSNVLSSKLKEEHCILADAPETCDKYAVQLIIGKTLRMSLGEEAAAAICRSIRVGQLVMALGVLKKSQDIKRSVTDQSANADESYNFDGSSSTANRDLTHADQRTPSASSITPENIESTSPKTSATPTRQVTLNVLDFVVHRISVFNSTDDVTGRNDRTMKGTLSHSSVDIEDRTVSPTKKSSSTDNRDRGSHEVNRGHISKDTSTLEDNVDHEHQLSRTKKNEFLKIEDVEDVWKLNTMRQHQDSTMIISDGDSEFNGIHVVDTMDQVLYFSTVVDALLNELCVEEANNPSLLPRNETESAFNVMRRERLEVGVDCEWRPSFWTDDSSSNKDKDSAAQEAPVAILQLATRKGVFVFDLQVLLKANDDLHDSSGEINKNKDVSMESYNNASQSISDPASLSSGNREEEQRRIEHLLNAVLQRIFYNPRVLKLGFDVSSDFQRLVVSFPLMTCFHKISSVVDMKGLSKSYFANRKMEYLHIQPSSLSKLCQLTLNKSLDKTEQCSAWHRRPLKHTQIAYAALDAAVLIKVFDKMQSSINLNTCNNASDHESDYQITADAIVDRILNKEHHLIVNVKFCMYTVQQLAMAAVGHASTHDEAVNNDDNESYSTERLKLYHEWLQDQKKPPLTVQGGSARWLLGRALVTQTWNAKHGREPPDDSVTVKSYSGDRRRGRRHSKERLLGYPFSLSDEDKGRKDGSLSDDDAPNQRFRNNGAVSGEEEVDAPPLGFARKKRNMIENEGNKSRNDNVDRKRKIPSSTFSWMTLDSSKSANFLTTHCLGKPVAFTKEDCIALCERMLLHTKKNDESLSDAPSMAIRASTKSSTQPNAKQSGGYMLLNNTLMIFINCFSEGDAEQQAISTLQKKHRYGRQRQTRKSHRYRNTFMDEGRFFTWFVEARHLVKENSFKATTLRSLLLSNLLIPPEDLNETKKTVSPPAVHTPTKKNETPIISSAAESIINIDRSSVLFIRQKNKPYVYCGRCAAISLQCGENRDENSDSSSSENEESSSSAVKPPPLDIHSVSEDSLVKITFELIDYDVKISNESTNRPEASISSDNDMLEGITEMCNLAQSADYQRIVEVHRKEIELMNEDTES